MRAFLGRLLLFTGILLLVLLLGLLYERYRPNPLGFNESPKTRVLSETTSSHLPIRITLPKQQIDLRVFGASVTDGMFETTNKGVSYLLTSGRPESSSGNAVFYGHNWPNILGSLGKMQIGDVITVSLENGEKLSYSVAFISVVSPNQTSILEDSSDARLTLYTCTGFLDTKRLVVTAVRR